MKPQREPASGIHGGDGGPDFFLVSAESSTWDFTPSPPNSLCCGGEEIDRETPLCLVPGWHFKSQHFIYQLHLVILLFASEIYFRSSQRSEDFKSSNRDDSSVLSGEANTRLLLPKPGLLTAVSHGGTFYRA